MISKNDITKLARRIIRRQKGLHDHQMIHPKREWLVGLFFGLVLLVSGGAWSIITYDEVKNLNIESVNITEIEQTIYRGDMVEAALKEFRDRKESYQLFLDETDVVIEVSAVEEELAEGEGEEAEENIEAETPASPIETIEGEEEPSTPEQTVEDLSQSSSPPETSPEIESGV